MIEDTPTADIERLKKDPKIEISQAVSNRLIYFFVDHARDVTPFAKGKDGAEIKNPFKDKRVRQAMSKAINRDAIVVARDGGRGDPGGPAPARRLLRRLPQARSPSPTIPTAPRSCSPTPASPNGFKLTLHTPNGRYINDVKIAEAVAQMLTRVGIETALEALPPACSSRVPRRAGRTTRPEFSFILVGWGDAARARTRARWCRWSTPSTGAKGTGTANRGRYSNPEVDQLSPRRCKTNDDAKRAALLAKATEIAIEDVALIPSHYQVNTWAARKGLKYKARSDEYTLRRCLGHERRRGLHR